MTLWRYSVRYRRTDYTNRTYRLTVSAASADDARRKAAIRDPQFSHTVESPKRRGAVEEVAS